LIQVYMRPEQIVSAGDIFNRLTCPIVFDHVGALSPIGTEHPAFDVLRRLIEKGQTWVKLSGAYLDPKAGPDGAVVMGHTTDYSKAGVVAKAFLKLAPERMVWGSDWPHPTLAATEKANDATLFDLLLDWAPDERLRHRILVENPETLYGFSTA